MRLFAVLLGGNCAPRSNTELHDVVFVAGERLEDTYRDLVDLWFGTPEGLHIDSWIALDVADGHRVRLGVEPPEHGKRLYFVNLGAYKPGAFLELHDNAFYVAESPDEAKRRAKRSLLKGMVSVHKDDLFAVDDCLDVGARTGLRIALEPTEDPDTTEPHSRYQPLPKSILRASATARQRE
jgi:hypothetical protein